jgi:acetoin utilization deacetylase AcuC-like enzyme
MQSPQTGLVYSDVFLRHDTGPDHPERPERLTAIVERLRRAGLMERLTSIPFGPATVDQLTAVHTAAYVERVRRTCAQGAPWVDDADTCICRESYEVALSAAGGVLAAVDAVAEGRVRNAFCAVRPPGHHASAGRAMGFCLFNNVAIAARYAQSKHNLRKVLIVDWDVHHGNGTQDVFYSDPTVLYFSVHQYPHYPGTGAASETGAGEGVGLTVNAPLPAGSRDEAFIAAFREKLRPAALAFRPDIVLVSAGFDAHRDDPIAGMAMTADGFGELTRIVKDIAETCCKGRLVSVLEGGYGLAGLAESVEAHLRVLMQ